MKLNTVLKMPPQGGIFILQRISQEPYIISAREIVMSQTHNNPFAKIARLNAARQQGGLLLAGTGRAGVHASKKYPSAKTLRQSWANRVNRGDYE